MRGLLRLSLLALVAILLAPIAAYAQASVTGTVKDTSGAVLPGVTVEVASPALIEKTRCSSDLLHQDGSRPSDRRDGKTATGIAGIVIWQRSGNRRLEGRGILCH